MNSSRPPFHSSFALNRTKSASVQSTALDLGHAQSGRLVTMAIFALLLLQIPNRTQAEEPTNLGFELSYLRVHALEESLPALNAAITANRALVLDLRYAKAADKTVDDLRSALAAHRPETELFILVSPATPAALADALTPLPLNVVTIGILHSQPAPKILVKTDAETDRAAYDALTTGTPLEKLLSGRIEKDRFDEATLVQEFKNGNTEADGSVKSDPAKPATPSAAPAILIDRVLQRAYQIHRALQVLRR